MRATGLHAVDHNEKQIGNDQMPKGFLGCKLHPKMTRNYCSTHDSGNMIVV